MTITGVAALLAAASAMALAQDGDPPAARVQQRAPVAAKAAPRAPIDPAVMKQLLKDWEKQSAKLKTLQVSIYRIDKDTAWEDEIHYEGRAAFQSPQLAFLDFHKIKLQKNGKKFEAVLKNGKRILIPWETLVMTGEEVWDYKYDTQQVFIYPLPKDQQKRALEGGPLPFLFNMKAEEAERRYKMTLLAQNDKQHLVRVEPLLEQDKEDFSQAFVWLEATYLLPQHIRLISPDKKSSRDYRLSNIKPNFAVEPTLFQGVNPGKPWKVVRVDPDKPKAAPSLSNGVNRPRPTGVGAARAAINAPR
jgi:TIGR03009 family protein